MKAIYILIIIVLCCQLLFAEEAKTEILFPDHHLCLEASGKVVVKADKAVFSFTSTGYGATLRAAVTNAKARVSDLTKDLVAVGITNDSFSTSSFTTGKNLNAPLLSDKKDYSATLNTTVTLRDLTKLDEAILILTDKKAENLSNISYSLDDQSKIRQQAREIAFNRICEQRNTIVRILGVNVTDVLLIDEAPFDQLPWNTQQVYRSKGYENAYSNTVTSYDKSEPAMMSPDALGGIYTPDVTVETQVRVLYRVGLKQ